MSMLPKEAEVSEAADLQAEVDRLNTEARARLNSDLEGALALTQQARELAEKSGNKTGLAYSWYIRSTAEYLLAQYNPALESGQTALNLYRELGDRLGEARTLNTFSGIYSDLGDYQAALEASFGAYNAHSQIGNKQGISLVMANIGYYYQRLEQWDTALKSYREALEAAEEVGNQTRIGSALNGVGYTLLKLKRSEEARDYLFQAMEVLSQGDDYLQLCYTYHSLGTLYQELQQPDQSLDYLTKALELERKIGYKIEVAKTLLEIGNLYYGLGQLDASARSYEEALQIAQEINSQDVAYQVHLSYSKIYEARQDWVNALSHYKQYAEAKAEVTSTESQKVIVATQARFNLEKAENEREIFRLRNVELAGALEEVESANREIALLNERLKSENMRMSAELEVTQRLQQMVLPGEQELAQVQGLEIAPFMLPANEVGGDYYDILQHQGRVKIGIGDVTGHGLESGVLMLMVQTAVRSLLVNEQADPVNFITILNEIIYQNLQRMKVDKSLSLLLLDYASGELTLSGQHEQVIILRQGGQLEVLDTMELGFPIGLVDDIADFVAFQSLRLNPGDVVVLFTDGITEAENPEREQYGFERMCAVVAGQTGQNAWQIRQAVIDDLMDFIGPREILDDITLLVLRQTE